MASSALRNKLCQPSRSHTFGPDRYGCCAEEGVPPIERGSINPRMSGWVKHGNVVYTSGQVGEPGPEVDGVKTAMSVTEQVGLTI